MADNDAPPAGGKQTRNRALLIGGVALGGALLYFVWQRYSGGGAANTSASTGTTSAASPGTDMGDIVQTVQGPPGQQGKPGQRGPRGPAGKTTTRKATDGKTTPPAKRPTRRPGPVRRRKAAA